MHDRVIDKFLLCRLIIAQANNHIRAKVSVKIVTDAPTPDYLICPDLTVTINYFGRFYNLYACMNVGTYGTTRRRNNNYDWHKNPDN